MYPPLKTLDWYAVTSIVPIAPPPWLPHPVPRISQKLTHPSFSLSVARFVTDLYQAMIENDVGSTKALYYKVWREITRSYYAETEWPSAEHVSGLCDENEVFLLCYSELCNRHVFMNLRPNLNQRMASWTNYRLLFDTFLDGASTSRLLLPLEWLNDMIDEFLYQWQDFTNFKREQGKSAEEIQALKEYGASMWTTPTVLGYLTSFVERSQIARDLAANANPAKGANASHPTILKAMGAFSLVGLCRAHVLLADYRLALRVLDPVDIDDQRAIFMQVTPCAITLFHSLGFAYLMSKRYTDALQIFTRVLISHRSTKESSASFAEDQIVNKYDKILALAALSSALNPGSRPDEQVKRMIGEKFEKFNVAQTNPKMNELLAVFTELFAFACPKFVNPAPPTYALVGKHDEAGGDPRKEMYRVQLKWFLEDVRQQLTLPTIRSFLKLYKSIPVDKLSRFCNMEMDEFRQNLIFIKSRSSQVVRGISDGSAPVEGTRMTVSDVHYYVVGDKNSANDMVHIVADVSQSGGQRGLTKFFSSNALRFQGWIDDMHRESKTGDESQGGQEEEEWEVGAPMSMSAEWEELFKLRRIFC